MGTALERIEHVANHQRGRVARRQLLAAGVPSGTIDWEINRRRMIPVTRGVYAVGHTAEVELAAETVALLAARDGAVLSHWTAARLWGMIRPDPGDEPIDVLVRGGRSASTAGVRTHRTRTLNRADVRIHRGLPLTSPARTLLDIAPLVTPRRLELMIDRACVDGLVTQSQLAARVAAGHPGGGRVNEVLGSHNAPMLTRSEAEERVLKLIREAGLPMPKMNARVHGYEVDFYWPAHRFVLEVDGYRFHSTRRAFEHDRRKDSALRAAGVQTMRTTWRQVDREALMVVAHLAQGLAWAAPSARP